MCNQITFLWFLNEIITKGKKCSAQIVTYQFIIVSVKYRNRQGHVIHFYTNRQKKKLMVDGHPFSRDTMKGGWVYWRCVGHRKTGFDWYYFVVWMNSNHFESLNIEDCVICFRCRASARSTVDDSRLTHLKVLVAEHCHSCWNLEKWQTLLPAI